MCQDVRYGETQEYIRPGYSLLQGVEVTGGSELSFGGIQVGAIRPDHTLTVAHHDVLSAGTQHHIEFSAGDGSRSGSIDHDLHLVDTLAGYLQGIDQTGTRDDRCAMLVVVHHGDVEFCL